MIGAKSGSVTLARQSRITAN